MYVQIPSHVAEQIGVEVRDDGLSFLNAAIQKVLTSPDIEHPEKIINDLQNVYPVITVVDGYLVDGEMFYEKIQDVPITDSVITKSVRFKRIRFDGTPINVKDFKGTGLGEKTIEVMAENGITTVEQVVALGTQGITEFKGVSDEEADKIFNRAKEILSA